MILSYLTAYKWVGYLLAVVAIVGSIAYGVHRFISYERNIGYQKAVAEYTAKELLVAKAVAAKQSELMKQIKDAQNEADKRGQEISKLSGDLDITTKRMRNTIAGLRSKVAGLTADAARRQADSALDVSGECSEEYAKMAAEAARLSSQLMLMQESWPK